jgi:hypothetical protein
MINGLIRTETWSKKLRIVLQPVTLFCGNDTRTYPWRIPVLKFMYWAG